jgi:hypothetical protein
MTQKEIISEEELLRKKEEKKKMWIRIGISVTGWLSVSLILSIIAGIVLEVQGQRNLNFGGYIGLFIVFCICFFPIDYYIDAQFKKR